MFWQRLLEDDHVLITDCAIELFTPPQQLSRGVDRMLQGFQVPGSGIFSLLIMVIAYVPIFMLNLTLHSACAVLRLVARRGSAARNVSFVAFYLGVAYVLVMSGILDRILGNAI